MNKQIDILKQLLGPKKNSKSYDKISNSIKLFQLQTSLLIPPDLAEYFKLSENAIHKFEKGLYQFYLFDQFKSIKKELAFWGGVPNYRNICNTLEQCENCFVLGNYMFHLFAYAIRLHQNFSAYNEIYLICGDKYKLISNSFSGFLDLYFDNSEELRAI